jgi:hypothetical protein
MIKNLLILFITLTLTSAAVLGQGVTTAAMYGKVTDNTGSGLPGANIVATHVPSGTIYGTTSRANGDYNIPGMRVGGPYTLSVSFVGFAKKEYKDIVLQLSQNLRQDVRLAEEAVRAGEVLVTAERSAVLSASHTGANTNVVREQIDRVPSITRNFQDFYKLSPYFNPTSTSASGSSGNALGRNSKYNNIQIDGTNFNDLFGLGSSGAPGGQSSVTPISLDALEEFQISVSPFDVRQAGFTGAGINAVTRSGTNQYKGSVFYYGRNEGFVGKSPDTLKAKLTNFKDNQIGFRVGGPIIENNLFFFANAEMTRFSQPFSRTFGNTALGTNAYTVSKDSLDLLTNTLKTKYGYDPGSYSDIGYNRESDKIFVRFDYNLSESHRLTARWNYLRSSEDNSPSRGRALTDIYFDNGKYKLDDKTHSVALQLSSVFSNAMSNEFIMGYVNQSDIPIYYGKAFPTLYIATRANNVTQNLVLGAEEFRHYNELGQKYIELTDNFSYYMGDHTFTVGAKLDLFSFRNLFIPDAFGAYTYGTIAQFVNDQKASSYSFRYSATNTKLQEANWTARQLGLYAQDEWMAMPGLKVTAGLRVDIPTYPEGPNENTAIFNTFGYHTSDPPKTTIAYSPRLGFNYAVDEERNTQVRGGIGVFYGRFPFVWVSNQYSNTGVDFYTYTTPPNQFNQDPDNQAKPSSAALPSAEVDLTKSNFKAPSILRYNLAIDHRLPYDIVATVEGIFSATQNDVYYQNINLAGLQDAANVLSGRGSLTPGGVIAGEGREVWGKISDTNATKFSTVWINSAQFSPGVFLVRNTTQGSNANVVVQLQRSVPDGLNGTLAYTWGMAKDINSGNSTQAASGWRFNPTPGDPNKPQLTYSQWDRRHRVLGAISYRYDWGMNGLATTIGAFYNGQSGRPFSYLVSGDINGDGRTDNDLAYIPKDANDILLVSSAAGPVLPTSNAAYTQLMDFINADPYLKDNKGKISERSGPREPWSHMLDLRIDQEVDVMPGHKIDITLDILNVLNLLKGEWGWVKNTGVNQNVFMYTFTGLDKTPGANYGKPHYSLQSSTVKVTDAVADPFVPDNILSRWQMQLGIRYTM